MSEVIMVAKVRVTDIINLWLQNFKIKTIRVAKFQVRNILIIMACLGTLTLRKIKNNF